MKNLTAGITILERDWRNRRAVSWATFREWRRLTWNIVPYPSNGSA